MPAPWPVSCTFPPIPNGGIAAARAEARKNGYTNNVNAEIVANPDPSFSAAA